MQTERGEPKHGPKIKYHIKGYNSLKIDPCGEVVNQEKRENKIFSCGTRKVVPVTWFAVPVTWFAC